MPPDFLGKLRQLFMPSGSPSANRVIKETLTSPLADSLWSISGGGKPVTSRGYLQQFVSPGALGTYDENLDWVTVIPREFPQTNEADIRDRARGVLMHEAGHRVQARRNPMDVPGGNAPFKLPPQSPRVDFGRSHDNPPERRRQTVENLARFNVDSYYQTDPAEGYAQAFESAWQVLSRSPELLKKGYDRNAYAQYLAEAEAQRPGVGQIVSDLLKNEPMFRNHPLQAFYRSGGNR
jgi:hypothetical protein